MTFASKIAILAGLASTAVAHGTVTSFVTDGTENGGFLLDYYYMEQNGQEAPETAGWYAENLDNGFVEPNAMGTADVICHKNARAATSSATVAAGGTVDFQWSEWPESHIGPVITYAAACEGDCADADKEALKWVKIDASGLEDGVWATDAMIANGNLYTANVPETLAAGNYVFRHEIIALHSAGAENGAQLYPQCMNIEVTGSGTEKPEGVLGTALYTVTEPGILFDPYAGATEYTIPGPPLFGSGEETEETIPTPSDPATPSGSGVPSGTAAPTAAPSASEIGAPVLIEQPEDEDEEDEDEDDEFEDDECEDDGGEDDEDEDDEDETSDIAVPTETEEASGSPTGGSTNTPSTPTESSASPSDAEPTSTGTPKPTGSPSTPKDTEDFLEVPSDGSTSLPSTFTLETFIEWLQQMAGGNVERRHAKDVQN